MLVTSLTILLTLIAHVQTRASAPDVPGRVAVADEQVTLRFLSLLSREESIRSSALRDIERSWENGFAPMMIEVLYFIREPSFSADLVRVLERKTGKSYGYDLDQWYRWLWSRDDAPHPDYPTFKKQLYGLIDEAFAGYFDLSRRSLIRLEEVRWGGVKQDGIPPLRDPKMIAAEDADYLADDNVVFGIEINGDARAYPKRILAHHEMFVDDVGGAPIAGVYCTLCGTMIIFETTVDGTAHYLGTSGFLYRSNKLMYDKATQSLWNTIWGRPVIGPLVNADIVLPRHSVVTTTWGEWRSRHPETSVLALETGHRRDYREGQAYKEYFATDELMFIVPELDKRLKNKDEVLTLIADDRNADPLAIAASFLEKHAVYHDEIGETDIVVLTDASGANRVYETHGVEFATWDRGKTVVDSDGNTWALTESRLEGPNGEILHRLPAQRAFWFGWYSAFPQTRLVK